MRILPEAACLCRSCRVQRPARHFGEWHTRVLAVESHGRHHA